MSPGRRIFFSRVNFLTDFYSVSIPAVACKRLQSFCRQCGWQVTHKHPWLNEVRVDWMCCPGIMCESIRENELTRNLSGNAQPQSSQLTEPLWTDPGQKSVIGVHKLVPTLKKKKNAGGGWFIKSYPKILACEEQATTTTMYKSRKAKAHNSRWSLRVLTDCDCLSTLHVAQKCSWRCQETRVARPEPSGDFLSGNPFSEPSQNPPPIQCTQSESWRHVCWSPDYHPLNTHSCQTTLE